MDERELVEEAKKDPRRFSALYERHFGRVYAFVSGRVATREDAEDADDVYRRALSAGATRIYEPADQPYGDREAGVRDPAGNHWYIGTHKATGKTPEGMRTVTPVLHPDDLPRLIDFLEKALGAHDVVRDASPSGAIVHATSGVGDSVVELGPAQGQWGPMPASAHGRHGLCSL